MGKNKIAKVITSCNDCEYKMNLVEQNGNTYYAVICAFARSEYNQSKNVEPFILEFMSDDPRHYSIDIPDNCPLEDYNDNM